MGVVELKVVDEDGGEAAGHPDADVEQEDGQEAQELPRKGHLALHHLNRFANSWMRKDRY